MANLRTSIPSNLVADVLFSSDYTCCVCRERGKTVQIHHIDENPNNNVFGNLSALCFECHSDTQIKSAFKQKLKASVVLEFRDEWLNKLELRRNIAIEMALSQQVQEGCLSQQVEKNQPELIILSNLTLLPIDYISSLPKFRVALLNQGEWNSGITEKMVQQNYDYIDCLSAILVTLANYFTPQKFDNHPPQEYFSEIISSRLKWYKTISQPNDEKLIDGKIDLTCAGSVMFDVEKMIEDMVMGLVGCDDKFDWYNWSIKWNAEKN